MDRRAAVLSVAMVLLITWGGAALGADCGEPVPAPKYQAGDKWTWRDEKAREWSNEVVQVEGDITQIKWPTGSVAFHDKDWVIRQVRRSNGELVTKQGSGQYTSIGQKVLDFPLHVGKKWEYSYTSQPTSNLGDLRTYYNRYTIVACEEVSTPAARFPALKVEVDNRSVGARISGVYYLWYAPQVKNFVRRQFVPSQAWNRADVRDYELIKFETK